MATNTAALKKGSPPPREKTADVIKQDPRPTEGRNKPLQIMVPPEVFDAFSQRAGQEFGFTKGSKSQLFLAMWQAYQSR
ncbi:MAG: hypothetical protein EOM26_13760 [Alphaproteobacteria bacterium]|nr:hypothetical protein [Alphaproteobacteria bacterium]